MLIMVMGHDVCRLCIGACIIHVIFQSMHARNWQAAKLACVVLDAHQHVASPAGDAWVCQHSF